MKKENLDIISKNIKTAFSVPVIFLFLTLFNYNASGQTGTTLKNEIDKTIEEEQIKIDEILKENQKDENKIKIKMSQLLEQGKQVVKPWEHSWQFGINYFHYSSHGKSAPHYEKIFVRDKSIFNRNVHPEGEAFKHLVTRYDEHSASNNLREDHTYGSVNIKHDNEPMGSEKLFPTLNQKPLGDIFVPEIKEGVYVEPITVKPLNFAFDTPKYGFEIPIPKVPQRIGFGRGMLNIHNDAYISTSSTTPNFLPVYEEKNVYEENVYEETDEEGSFPIVFSQQSYSSTNKENKGKFNITFLGDGVDNKIHIKSDNVSFTSVYFDDKDKKHKEALTTSDNFDTDAVHNQERYPLAFSGGNAFEIKNVDMVFDNKNPVFKIPSPEFNSPEALNVVSSITPYSHGDTTLVIDKDSSITLTGMSTLFAYVHSTNDCLYPEYDKDYLYYNLAVQNKGKFDIKGTQQTGIVAHVMKNHPLVIENSDSGRINVDGEENSFAIITRDEYYPFFYDEQKDKYFIPKFSVINDGEFKVSGKNNTGLILEHGVGEVILNKPITIDGENSIGIKFEPEGELNIFAAGTDVKQDAHNSSDPEINSTSIIMAGDSNGKLRNSLLNINIGGKNNYGIFGLSEYYGANVDNFNIKSENGEGNNLIWINNPYKTNSSIGTKLTGNDISKNLVIKGGRNNTGITFYGAPSGGSSTLVGKGVKIDIQNSPQSVGIQLVNQLGILENSTLGTIEGDINVDSPASTALLLNQSYIINDGKINFKSSSYNDGTKDIGAVGIAVVNTFPRTLRTSFLLSDGDVNIDISGKNSVGLLSADGSNIQISNSHISARDKGVAVYANGGIITFEDNNTIDIHENGVGFLNEGLIGFTGANPTVMNIHGNAATGERGVGAVIPQSSVGFDQSFTDFNKNLFAETMNNLKINLDGGIAFHVDGAEVEYSHTLPNYVKNTLQGPDITGNGAVFSLNGGKLTVDIDMNLDSPGVLLSNTQVEVENGINVTGTKDNEHFIMFENKSEAPSSVANTNAGNIKLDGDKSVAIYVKNADAENSGDIKLTGKESVAMEVVNDNISALGDLTVSNSGNITIGEKGIGIYYTGTSADGSNKITGNIENSNTIESNGKESVGILVNLKDNLTLNTLKNSGNIKLSGDNSIGIAAKENRGNFNIENSGNITVGDSDKTQSSVGILNNNQSAVVTNFGHIKAGKNGIGIYGYEIKSLAGSEVTVGDGGIGFYSPDKNLDVKGDLHIGKDAVGIYTGGNNREIKAELGTITSGDKSVIILNKGNGNKIVSSTPNVNLGNNSVFILSKDANSKVENSTKLNSTGNYNVGIYGKDITNSRDMDFSAGTGNIAIHSVYGGEATNTGHIKVGKSDRENNMFSIGMAGGYFDANNNRNIYEGTVINRAGGVIEVGEKAIGLYATGRNSKAINEGTINITGKDGIGIYVDNGAVGENHGTITATADATGAIGALALNGAVFKNYKDITITAPQGTGVTVIRGGEFEKGNSSSTITAETAVIDENSESSGKKLPSVAINQTHGGGFEITVGDVKIPVAEIDTDVPEPQPQYVDVVIPDVENNRLDLNEHGFNKHESNAEITKFGMYIDTSGVNYTNPIKGLSHLPNLKDIELIFGVEGAIYTNEKAIKIGKNILEPYNNELKKCTGLENVTPYSGSLTWIGKPEFNSDGKTIKKVNLVKRPYTDFSMGDENLRRFTDGLEKRYGVEDIYSREKELFNKLNDIGKNENILLNQAFKEMMGYQYTNTDRRIADSRRTFDREFDTLMKWDTETKDTTKVKMFREDSKFRTDSGNGTSYNRTANGVFILNNNETVTLGDSQGWFFGVSQDDFKFRDIGRSKEKSINGQVGYYKAQAFGHNRETNYLIKGGIDGSYRKMYRRYLVVDDIFEGRSRYHSMGIFLDGEVSKEFRITEGFKLKPSVGVDLSLEKFSNINEKRGEMRLVSKGRTELTATPKAEVVLSHSTDRSDNWRIRTDLGYKIYKPYARNTKMKARVNYTDADWYSLERDRYHSSSEISFGIALEKPEYGIGAKVLRNLNQHYTGYQVDFRIKF